MRLYLLCFLFLFHSLASKEQSPLVQRLNLSLAKTQEQMAWGLMRRSSLATNEGMLFTYPKEKKLRFWMFNCLINLNLGLFDSDHVLREIHNLSAYPEKMDPKRPVYSLRDFSLYPPSDPIRLFFAGKTVQSRLSCRYALELNEHWFSNNGFSLGSVLQKVKGDYYLSSPINLQLLPKGTPTLLSSPVSPELLFFWTPNHSFQGSIIELSSSKKILKRYTLREPRALTPQKAKVFRALHPETTAILVTPSL